MNNSMRWIWILAGSVVAMTLIAMAVIFFAGKAYMPNYFWTIPVFFLLLTGVLGLITRNYVTSKRELSVATILGIRVFFISLIAVFLIISVLIDREHILPLAILIGVFMLKFSFFETKVLLLINKNNTPAKQ